MRFVALGLLVALPAFAQPAQVPFTATAPIKLSGKEGLHRIEIPFEVYRDARADMADVRVLNRKGEQVPIAFAGNARVMQDILPALALPIFPVTSAAPAAPGGKSEITVRTEDGTLVAIRGKSAPSPAKTAAYLLDASQVKEPIRALAFDWQAAPGSEVVRVRVEASDDLKSWSALGAGPLVKLQNQGRTLEQPRVEFSPRTAKYLRVTWDARNFVLSGVRAEREPRSQPAELLVKTVKATTGEDPGEWLYDLGAALPVESVRLVPGESNDVVSAAISARSASKDTWRSVLWAPFYRMRIDGVEKQSPPLEIGRLGARYWMVKVPPASVSATAPLLEVSWRPTQLVFVAKGEGPFSLAYGNPGLRPAALTLQAIYPDYVRHAEWTLPLATVEDPVATPPPTAMEKVMADVEPKRVVLWLILVLGVGVLAFMAWRLTRR